MSLYEQIETGTYSFPRELFANVSEQGANFTHLDIDG